MDLAEVMDAFRAEAEELAHRAAQVSEDEWTRPTRCEPWSARELLGHVCVVLGWVPGMLVGPSPRRAEVSAREYYRPDHRFAVATNTARLRLAEECSAGHASGAALAEGFGEIWRRVDGQCRQEPEERAVVTRHGDAMLLSDFMLTRVVEVAVHGLDLADALGREPWLTQEAGDLLLQLLAGSGAKLVDELGWSRPTFLRKATGRAPLDAWESDQIERLGLHWLALG
ncbi:maleylpyruvate isomerase N-terminal domain-containing protein [Streptacidiphilus sp. N1-10]|uniref:Maleylpyruvate isomerase N-terminal domain-containing protein n=1 Tax=Streptacidiphilus jeojiensis TaxID=3229225 RepID=A0ABV6XNY0_9ACTN